MNSSSLEKPEKLSAQLIGIALVSFSTMLLELIDSRILSVMTWYHLSFLAISLAMLGMATGGIIGLVFRKTFEVHFQKCMHILPIVFGLSIIGCRALSYSIPFYLAPSLTSLSGIVGSVLLLTLPYLISGLYIMLAITQNLNKTNLMYASDLAGAATACILATPLMNKFDPFTIIVISSIFTIIAGLLSSLTHRKSNKMIAGLAICLFSLLAIQELTPYGFVIKFAKGGIISLSEVQRKVWNSHSLVMTYKAKSAPPQYWGEGIGSDQIPYQNSILMNIDGAAGTTATQWDGKSESLDWVKYDVTSSPYHIRKGGDAAIIGVGGGRDILTAIWANSTSVVGLEINSTFINLLRNEHRDFTKLSADPRVQLYHTEARSYLTATQKTFDIIQMSLIDTWASTGAGAFTLSENGLYTREAWKTFLSRLKTNGIFSVSRWFDPVRVSETTRLLSLGVASVIDLQDHPPNKAIVLISRNNVATLMIAPSGFSPKDLEEIKQITKKFGFEILASPMGGKDEQLQNILNSTSFNQLVSHIDDPNYNYLPPTDNSPFFFNMLKPAKFLTVIRGNGSGVIGGNLLATASLVVLAVTVTLLTGLGIFLPLSYLKRRTDTHQRLGAKVLYFSTIGFSYMMLQMAFVQKLSILLGHPNYSLIVILGTMILFTGLGSMLSNRIQIQNLKLATTLLLLLLGLSISVFATTNILEQFMGQNLTWRIFICITVVAPISLVLGCLLPSGMRLLPENERRMAPWLWGINGAFGVLGTVFAVCTSMWGSITITMCLAASSYICLAPVLYFRWNTKRTKIQPDLKLAA